MCSNTILALLLFSCQIIVNKSSVITAVRDETPSATTIRPKLLPPGFESFPEDHAAYKIYEELKTWNEARDHCVSEGARLAITDSHIKIDHINSLKNPSGQWLHVGIYKSETHDDWVRVDNGRPLTSVPWASDNPDGTGNCAGISFVGSGLVDYPCRVSEEYFVCEITI